GEPAIFDKWSRAEAAVRGGADLILELPITCAVSGAGHFAAGAVKCLLALGCIDYLSFGSECGDGEALEKNARLLKSPAFEEALSEALQRGISYAAARTAALEEIGGDGSLLKSPNNALGLSYLGALMGLNSRIQPVTIPREMSLSSASQLRESLTENDAVVSLPAGDVYAGKPLHTLLQGEKAMLAVLRTLPDEAFRQMAFEGEGIWSKVMKASRREVSLMDVMMAVKSKRYALSRIRRTLLCLFLGIDREKLALEPPYLRVLAFNDRGREVLSGIRKTSGVPLVSGQIPDTEEARAYFQMEARATDLYGLFAPEGIHEPCMREKATPPIYVKKSGEKA
ncbi:MAG: nucleotidyltransferase family protein, partial [Oscillospiraceae bacterium]|nr:nucleotidyltransferase family protein [Oscillospiraceae bacterium]